MFDYIMKEIKKYKHATLNIFTSFHSNYKNRISKTDPVRFNQAWRISILLGIVHTI